MFVLPDLELIYQQTFKQALNAWFDRRVSSYDGRLLFTVVACAAMIDCCNVAPEFARLRELIVQQIGETYFSRAAKSQLEEARAQGWDTDFCIRRISIFPSDGSLPIILRW